MKRLLAEMKKIDDHCKGENISLTTQYACTYGRLLLVIAVACT